MGNLSKSEINEVFEKLGIVPGDTLFLHLDTMITLFIDGCDIESKTYFFVQCLLEKIGPDGTLFIPTFTYSFCKGDIYNPAKSFCKKEEMGLFPNLVLKGPFKFTRSMDPLFSVVILGKSSKEISSQLNCSESFGLGTSFDYLFQKNGKILCIGCSLDRATFIHYCEKQIGVSYRYNKVFSGVIESPNGEKSEAEIVYFVRDRNKNLTTDLSLLKSYLKSKHQLKVEAFSRAVCYSVAAQDFFYGASEILKTNPLGLTKFDKTRV